MSDYDKYSYYDGCEVEPKEYWEEQIYEIIHKVVDDKSKDIIEQLETKEKRIQSQQSEIHELKKKNKELESRHQIKIGMDKLAKLITKNNIFQIINSLGLEKTNDENYISGMNSEQIPITTKLVLLYYNDKDLILDILDLFDIKYVGLKDFKLPRDYDKDEIIDIMKNVNSRMIQTNGCYFGGNFGFWQRDRKEVPLQEVFMNPYIKDCFDIIIDKLKNTQYNYYSYLFEVTKYQDFTNDEILDMAKYLPDKQSKDLYDYHKRFIDRHKELLFSDMDFCDKYFKYVSDNKYNAFAIHNFNSCYQVKYLKTLELDRAIRLVNEFKLDDLQKKGIMQQIIG